MLRAVMVDGEYRNMSRLRAATLCVALASLTALGGCTSSHMAAETTAGVSLEGTWQVDPQASDDPQKTMARLRAEAQKIINRNIAAAGGTPPPPDGEPGRGPRRDPLQHSTAAHLIQAVMARSELLTIHQRPTQIDFDFGSARRSYTPGAHSVVSAEGGVGDQESGWNGRSYVIRIKAQQGPEVSEVFELSPDGKQLTEHLHIGAYELPAVDLKRIYNRATADAVRQLPTSD
jgi:hypothetical protein